jgi:hypothetical protein
MATTGSAMAEVSATDTSAYTGSSSLRRTATAKRVSAGVSTVTPKCAVSPANTGSQRPGLNFRCARLRHVCSIATPAMLIRVNVRTNPSESA